MQNIKLANLHSKRTMNFPKVTKTEVKEEILNLSSKKETKNDDIPIKILKKNVDNCIKEIMFIINDFIEKGIFPDDLNGLMCHLY